MSFISALAAQIGQSTVTHSKDGAILRVTACALNLDTGRGDNAIGRLQSRNRAWRNGRRYGLKIRWAEMPVWVRVPPPG